MAWRKKKRIFKWKSIIQTHHLSYDPDVNVKMYAEEHYYISKIDRFKRPLSKGFLTALSYFVLRHTVGSKDLDRVARKKEKKELAILRKMAR